MTKTPLKPPGTFVIKPANKNHFTGAKLAGKNDVKLEVPKSQAESELYVQIGE